MRPLRLLAVLGGGVLLFCCLGAAPGLLILPADFLMNLIGGWIMFLGRVAPEIAINIGGMATAIVCLAALVLGSHLFLSWFYREAGRRDTDEGPPERLWHWRWTLSIVGAVVLMFVAGISAVGVTHQTFWLATSPEPNLEGLGGIRDAANRTRSQNNLKQVVLAVQNYASTNQDRLPPAALQDEEGQPLLSWRVILLPYLEQESLYKEFKLDQPWDSPHNIKLLPRMPMVFNLPGADAKQRYLTFYRTFVGPGTLYPNPDGSSTYKIDDVPDGTSNTIFVVEAGEAVPWTKPEELAYSPKKPLPQMHSRRGTTGSFFLAGMLDGSVRAVSKTVSEQTLRHAIEANDGQILGMDW